MVHDVVYRALDKRAYLMIIKGHCFLSVINFMTPYLNRLDKAVQMRGHNISLELTNIIPSYHQIPPLI